MFGFFKNKEIATLEAKITELKQQAAHMHKIKREVEDNAFNDLYWLANQNGITAAEAARTERGFEILSLVVLNRQYALYLNESAIQANSELNDLKGKPRTTMTNEDWLHNIVMPVGSEIVRDEVDRLMPTLVKEVDQKLSNAD
ncbi:hypothetical protein R0K18_12490 [Pantoea sp. SIMBA_133]|uniref:hypothetical protein n=1 Tax=Pantoea TaxID=53335 RepID=UPI000762EDEA|nr:MULTISPECIES: hypothetical protein [Pantoea]AMB75007.1 hypothetical protein AW734_09830 [Pantoea ananatis]MCS3405040.1 hypothetical protein [Pantoea sp. B566]NCU09730.1 hypothetical protein [Pantoea ananatis]